jgi:hypothetical protein
VDAAALVRAVLGPHDGEEAELREVGLAAEGGHDAVVFLGLQVVALEDIRTHRGHGLKYKMPA